MSDKAKSTRSKSTSIVSFSHDEITNSFERLKKEGIIHRNLPFDLLEKVHQSTAERFCPAIGSRCVNSKKRIDKHITTVHSDMTPVDQHVIELLAHGIAQAKAAFSFDLAKVPLPNTESVAFAKAVMEQLEQAWIPLKNATRFMKRINDLASDESPDQRNQQNLVEDTVAEGPIASDRFGFAPIVGDKWSKSGSCRVNRAESANFDELREAGLYERLIRADHPLLQGFYDEIAKSVERRRHCEITGGGRLAYAPQIEKFMYQCLRANNRYGVVMNLNDCFGISRAIEGFFDFLRQKNVSVHMRDVMAKSLIAFHAFIVKHIAINRIQVSTLDVLSLDVWKMQCDEQLNEQKFERLTNDSRGYGKKAHEPYAVTVGLSQLESVQHKMSEIQFKYQDNNAEVCKRDYVYFLGGLIFTIAAKNCCRYEVFYKVLNEDYINKQSSKDGQHFVLRYKFPKKPVRSSSEAFTGAVVVEADLCRQLDVLQSMRDRLMTRKNDLSGMAPHKAFFRDMHGKSIKDSSLRQILNRFKNESGFGDYRIGCNDVRASAAQLGFNEFADHLLAGRMANKNVADLMQHSAQVHDNDYIHNDFGKYIMGYQELARLSSEQSQDPTVQARIEQLSQNSEKPQEENEELDENQDADEINYDDNDEEEDKSDDERLKNESTIRSRLFNVPLEENEDDYDGDLSFLSPLRDGFDLQEDCHSFKRQSRRSTENDAKRNCAEQSSSKTHVVDSIDKDILPVMFAMPHDEKVEVNSSSSSSKDEELDVSILDLLKSVIHVDEVSPPIEETVQAHERPPKTTKSLDDIIKEHNEAHFDQSNLVKKNDTNFWPIFGKMRHQKPVQGFPLEVRTAAGTGGGKGLFLKVDVEKGDVICDYRGRTALRSVHLERMSKLTEQERFIYEMYMIDFECKTDDGTLLELAVTAHQPSYNGSIVLGRFGNHSRQHANCKPFLKMRKMGDTFEVVIAFEATRKIKRGEQMLWTYGKYFNDYDWASKCPCCLPVQDSEESLPVIVPALLDDCTSYSQSLIARPLASKPLNNEALEVVKSVHSAIGKDAYFNKRLVHDNWKDAVNASRLELQLPMLDLSNSDSSRDTMMSSLRRISSDEQRMCVVLDATCQSAAHTVTVIGQVSKCSIGAYLLCTDQGYCYAEYSRTNRHTSVSAFDYLDQLTEVVKLA